MLYKSNYYSVCLLHVLSVDTLGRVASALRIFVASFLLVCMFAVVYILVTCFFLEQIYFQALLLAPCWLQYFVEVFVPY